MLDMQTLTGIESKAGIIWFTVILIGIMGAIYSRFGGLRSLAVLDTINGLGLLVGGFLIAWFALSKVGGGEGVVAGWNALYEKSPERMSSIGGAEQSVPFSTLFTGVALLNLFYWCTNQQIIQRTFGASSLAEGQKGVLLTGALKLLGPIYLVIPGIIAYHLYADQGVQNDEAYGVLVRDVLPPYLTGFFAAVMVGAILSSFNAALNSTSALFSIGVYKNMINPNGDEKSMVRAAKIFVTVIAIAAMLAAPLLLGQDSIFAYLQKMNGIYFIPIFAVVLMGMLNRRTPPIAATIGLLLGLSLISVFYFVPSCADLLNAWNIHDFHFLGIAFAIIIVVMQLITMISPLPEDWTLEATEKIDLTPWAGAKPVSIILVLVVIAIYIGFAR
jgi:SSS family solute:Na+ symporter